jgi:hypothetical protein
MFKPQYHHTHTKKKPAERIQGFLLSQWWPLNQEEPDIFSLGRPMKEALQANME